MEWPISWNDVKEKLDAVLPVVELETIMLATETSTYLSADDNDKMNKVAAEEIPFVLKFRSSNGTDDPTKMCLVCNWIYFANQSISAVGDAMEAKVRLLGESGEWQIGLFA